MKNDLTLISRTAAAGGNVAGKSLNKSHQLAEDLRRLAGDLGVDGKMPTVRDLCKRYATSHSTVVEALDPLETQGIVSRRWGNGIYVAPKIFRKSIAILLDAKFFIGVRRSPFWGILWGYCLEIAQQRSATTCNDFNAYLVHYETDEGDEKAAGVPRDIRRLAEEKRLDGAIAIGLPQTGYFWFRQREIPIVVYAGVGDWGVAHDLRMTGIGAEALIAQGCQRIGLWVSGVFNPTPVAAFEDALRARGRKSDPAFHWIDTEGLADPQNVGYDLARRMFGPTTTARPDGLVIGDDMVAEGAITALERMGLCVGRDVRIATVTNAGSPMLFRRGGSLICLEYEPKQIVDNLFDIISGILDGHPPDEMIRIVTPTVRITDNRLDGIG